MPDDKDMTEAARHALFRQITMQAKIKAAAEGNLLQAKNLCFEAGEMLRNNIPLQPDLARYIGEALVRIGNENIPPDEALNLKLGRGENGKTNFQRDMQIAREVALRIKAGSTKKRAYEDIGNKYRRSASAIRKIHENYPDALEQEAAYNAIFNALIKPMPRK